MSLTLTLSLTAALAAQGTTGLTIPNVTVTGEPIVGQPIDLTMTGTIWVPGEGYIIGAQQQIPPIDLGTTGLLEIVPVGLFFLPGDSSGTTTVTIPANVSFVGVTLYWQGVGLIIDGLGGELRLSNLVATLLESPAPENLVFANNPVTYLEGIPIADNAVTFDWKIESFDVDPPLPEGLSLDLAGDNESATLTGTPTVPSTETTYTVTGSNENGSTAVDLVMTIEPQAPTTFVYTNNPVTYTAGTPIPPNDPVIDAFIDTFVVTPPLPDGLMLDSQSGVISGTATASAPEATYNVLATNINGSLDTDVTITVLPAKPSDLSYSHPFIVYTAGIAITPNVATVTAEVVDTWSVSPPLPPGLSLSPTTGDITGTPSAVSDPQVLTQYLVEATNVSGTASFIIEMVIDSIAVPTLSVTGGGAPGEDISYLLSGTIDPPPVTEILAIDIATVAPSFTPNLGIVYLDNNSPTYMEINGDGSHTWDFPVPDDTGLIGTVYSAQATGFVFTLPNAGLRISNLVQTEITLPAPMNLVYPTANLTLFTDEAMDPQTPSVDGFADTWEIAPALPAGLTLDPVDGTIAGTPTATQTTVNYTVTASNLEGETTAPVSIRIIDGPFPQFGFAVNQVDNTLSTYTIDDETGQLRHLSYAVTGATASATPAAVVASADSRFVYTANALENTISAFAFDTATGELTSVGTIVPGILPDGLVIEETGAYLYATCTGLGAGGDGVYAYSINPVTGVLTNVLGSPFGVGTLPNDIAVHGDVIATCSGNGADRIDTYQIDLGTGALTNVSSLATGVNARGVEFSVDGAFVYTANQGDDNVSGYSVAANGALLELSGSPYDVAASGGDEPEDVATTRDGFVYIANKNGTVTGFDAAVGGDLIALGTTASGNGTRAVTASPNGEHLYVVNELDNEIQIYDISPAGALTSSSPVPTVRTRLVPSAFHVSEGFFPVRYSTSNAYVVAQGDNDVYEYSVNPTTGTLVQLGTTFTGALPGGVAVHPGQGFAYVTNQGSANVAAYSVNGDGTLQPLLPAESTGSAPWSMAWEPSGRYAFTFLGNLTGGVQKLTQQPDGRVVAGATTGAGATTRRGAIDPTGLFLYAPNEGVDTVSQYQILPSNGFLAPGSPASEPTNLGPLDVEVHPSGRFVYVASSGGGFVDVFTVDASTGVLTSAGSVAFGGGTNASSMVIEPTGQYLYVAFEDSDEIEIYSIDAATGQPTEVGGGFSPEGTDDQPVYITTDAAGKFLYAVHRGISDSIRPFAIDLGTGGLNDQPSASTGSDPRELACDRLLDTTSE